MLLLMVFTVAIIFKGAEFKTSFKTSLRSYFMKVDSNLFGYSYKKLSFLKNNDCKYIEVKPMNKRFSVVINRLEMDFYLFFQGLIISELIIF